MAPTMTAERSFGIQRGGGSQDQTQQRKYAAFPPVVGLQDKAHVFNAHHDGQRPENQGGHT